MTKKTLDIMIRVMNIIINYNIKTVKRFDNVELICFTYISISKNKYI